MTTAIQPAHGEIAYNARGQRVGAWCREPNGVLVLVKPMQNPERHKFKAADAWGTDIAFIERMGPDDGVRFTVPDGTVYWATRSTIETRGFRQDFGYGAQWLLPDKRWDKQAPLPLSVSPDPPATAEAPSVLYVRDGKHHVLLSAIEPSPFQPPGRARPELASIRALAASLERYGQLMPITIRVMGTDRFRNLDGNRRVAAARLLGWERIWAEPRTGLETDAQELALIHEINTQVKGYGSADVLESFRQSTRNGWSLPRYLEAANDKVRTRLGRWMARFPDAVEAERMMLTFRTPEALTVAISLVRYVHGPDRLPRGHHAAAQSERHALEADMLRWMALDDGHYLGAMNKTPLFGKPTAAQLRRAIKDGVRYSDVLNRPIRRAACSRRGPPTSANGATRPIGGS